MGRNPSVPLSGRGRGGRQLPPECSGSLFTSLDRFQAAIVRRKRRSTPPQLHERFTGAPGRTRLSSPNGEQPESAAHRTTSRCENGGSGAASAYPGGGSISTQPSAEKAGGLLPVRREREARGRRHREPETETGRSGNVRRSPRGRCLARRDSGESPERARGRGNGRTWSTAWSRDTPPRRTGGGRPASPPSAAAWLNRIWDCVLSPTSTTISIGRGRPDAGEKLVVKP